MAPTLKRPRSAVNREGTGEVTQPVMMVVPDAVSLHNGTQEAENVVPVREPSLISYFLQTYPSS